MDGLTLIVAINFVFFISLFVLKNVLLSLTLSVISFFILINFIKPKENQKKELLIQIPQIVLKDRQYITAIISLLLFIFLERFIGFNAALFAGFFLFSFLNNLDSRAPFFIAVVLLVLTAYLSISNSKKIAEDTAILVYYFMVIGTVWMIIEQKKEDWIENNHKNLEKLNTYPVKKTTPYLTYIITFVLIASVFISSYFVYQKFIKPKIVKVNNQKQNLEIKTPVNPQDIGQNLIVPNQPEKPKIKYLLMILNGTSIKGLASSTATLLKSRGWEEEFEIIIGNVSGDYKNSVLKYTTNLKNKIKKMEEDLNLKLETNELKVSSGEGEMILILGDD